MAKQTDKIETEEEMILLSVRIPLSLKIELKTQAASLNVNLQDYITEKLKLEKY